MVRQIKDILKSDITAGDNQEKLEDFKRDASAYGEHSLRPWRLDCKQLAPCVLSDYLWCSKEPTKPVMM